MELQDRILEIFDVLYTSAPKEHNKFGFMSEFQSRVKASLNSKDVESFLSKLIRKLGIKVDDIYIKDNKNIFDFKEVNGYEFLNYIRNNLEFLVILLKVKREERALAYKEKKAKTKKAREVEENRAYYTSFNSPNGENFIPF